MGGIAQPLGDSLFALMARMGRYRAAQSWVIALTLLKVTTQNIVETQDVLRAPISQNWKRSTELATGKTTGSEAFGS